MNKQIFLFLSIFLISGCEQQITFKTAHSQLGEILFCKEGKTLSGIYTMDTNGKNQVCILETRRKMQVFGNSSWSPDGKKILFTFTKMENDKLIDNTYIMDIESKIQKKIIKNIIVSSSIWSPDGRKIAFVTKINNEAHIYLIDINGENQKELINTYGTVLGFSWSPDGRKIVFDSNKEGNYNLYILNIDNSELISLTNTSIDECTPSWSPNGKKIAFGTIEGCYIIDFDGKNQRKVVDSSLLGGGSLGTSWSPDGKRLVFSAWGKGIEDVFIVDINGKNLKNLTNTKDFGEGFPSWRPIAK